MPHSGHALRRRLPAGGIAGWKPAPHVIPSPARRALTMVELLVVIVIIGVLASAVLVASSAVLERAKTNGTKAVLQVVADAIEEFKREQEANPTIARALPPTPAGPQYTYADRYGNYPPDELEVFTEQGVPGWAAPGLANYSLAPSRALIAPSTLSPVPNGWGAMRYYLDPDPDSQKNLLEHRELAALVVAIETLGDMSKAILDKIPDRNRTPGPLTADDEPAIFLDRPAIPGQGLNDEWGPEDLQIRYIVDNWGVPISYFAVRDYPVNDPPQGADPLASSNHPNWRQASTWFIQANRGLPLVMSYGPNGKDQLTQDVMNPAPAEGAGDAVDAAASMVGDFADSRNGRRNTIDHPLNADNVYISEKLRERLAEGPADVQ